MTTESSSEHIPAGTNAAKTMTLAEAAQLRVLDPARIRLRMAGAALRLFIEDEACWIKVSILRAFPLTAPEGFLSIHDDSGKEIGMLIDSSLLDADSKAVLESELARRYLVSIIHRVRSVKERFGTVDWEVDTNRGPCKFTTRDLRDIVLRSGPGHFLLTDVENNRYEVLCLDKLDPQSQASLLRHL